MKYQHFFENIIIDKILIRKFEHIDIDENIDFNKDNLNFVVIYIDIDLASPENIDIDIDKDILENIYIDIDKGISQNIDIVKILYR